jgi:hypothetical protein
MSQAIALLFGIPVLCIVVTVVCQFVDEMFSKKFVIDRRTGSADQRSSRRRSLATGVRHNRRYSDPVDPAGHSETNTEPGTETLPESLAAIASPILEPSIVRR